LHSEVAALRRERVRARELAAEQRRIERENRRLAAEERRRQEELELAPPSSGGGCDPNYGGCVPIDSDVDCPNGSGDGPSYAPGAVPVTGNDIYGLDSDSDGTACE
jgi:hypothetical protein